MKTENQIKNQNADTVHAPLDAHSALPGAPSRPHRTARRRMRRSQPPIQPECTCKQSNTAAQTDSSVPSVPSPPCSLCNSPSPSSSSRRARRPRRASPFQILPEFAQLSEADLAEVHDVIRDFTVPDAQKFILERHRITLSYHCLYRYRSRLHLADQLQVTEDNAPAIQNLLSLLAGKPVDLDKAGIHIIKQRAVGLAADPNSSPSLLKDLFRIFTYNDRLGLQQRRVKCHERMTKLAERRQKFVEKTHKKAPKKSTWQETADALVKVVGYLPPIIPYTGPLSPDIAVTPDSSVPPSSLDANPEGSTD